ncbi:MAG: 2-oxoacid:acceptor oxidoreductase family protein [Actinomycetota bacterium]
MTAEKAAKTAKTGVAAKTAPAGLGGKERIEIKLGGFGGQGIILAGHILGHAASVHAGRNAVMAQSYGPESRGGACMSEAIIANGEIAYPRVGTPDLMVMMSDAAYRKYAFERTDDCMLIVDEDLVKVDEAPGRGGAVLKVPATRLAESLGRRMMANIVMLGFVCRASGVLPKEAMEQAVAASVPKGTEKANRKAFQAGYVCADELLSGVNKSGEEAKG